MGELRWYLIPDKDWFTYDGIYKTDHCLYYIDEMVYIKPIIVYIMVEFFGVLLVLGGGMHHSSF